MQRELFGVTHPDIATSVSNVGNWYGEQGNLERALQYSKQALAMRRELFGEDHPNVATSLSDLGRWYAGQGNLDRALEYSQQALAIYRKLLTRGILILRHPSTISRSGMAEKET